MNFKALLYEYRRRQRIRNPEKNDYGSYMLTGIMGAEWWIEHGFERELIVGRCNLDYGHPILKIDIEADSSYHMDVLKDERRDSYLRSRGWYVVRFRYDRLRDHPADVRKIILQTYRNFSPATPEEIKAQNFRYQ